MRKWKDETSYSRGAKSRIPGILSLGLPHGIKLIVHRLVYISDCWFYSIRWDNSYLIQDRELESKNVEEAKMEAVTVAAKLLLGWSLALREGSEVLTSAILAEKKTGDRG